MHKKALVQVFVEVFWFFSVSLNPPVLYTDSFIYHGPYKISAIDTTIK